MQHTAFVTELFVQASHINFGGHLAHDALLGLLQEARMRFLARHGYSEKSENGVGIIMLAVQVRYLSQAYWGDCLRVRVSPEGGTRVKALLSYQVVQSENKILVARASTEFAFYDYHRQRPVRMPDSLRPLFD